MFYMHVLHVSWNALLIEHFIINRLNNGMDLCIRNSKTRAIRIVVALAQRLRKIKAHIGGISDFDKIS
jgi:hypothetical protein